MRAQRKDSDRTARWSGLNDSVFAVYDEKGLVGHVLLAVQWVSPRPPRPAGVGAYWMLCFARDRGDVPRYFGDTIDHTDGTDQVCEDLLSDLESSRFRFRDTVLTALRVDGETPASYLQRRHRLPYLPGRADPAHTRAAAFAQAVGIARVAGVRIGHLRIDPTHSTSMEPDEIGPPGIDTHQIVDQVLAFKQQLEWTWPPELNCAEWTLWFDLGPTHPREVPFNDGLVGDENLTPLLEECEQGLFSLWERTYDIEWLSGQARRDILRQHWEVLPNP